ncbi:MAG: proton-conducting transporter membrane subunit [bacterium]|nr:proton-conducting transporter membrane subunit [bacterium]
MDFNAFISDANLLPWLIPVGPLLAFLIITLLTNRSKLVPATSAEYGGHHPDYEGMPVLVVADRSRVISIIVGMSGAIAAWLISLRVVADALALPDFGKKVLESSAVWMSTGAFTFNMGVLVDPLTVIMLIMVPLAVVMIFIYSIGYMAHDPRQARFFSLISLFAGAMLTLVVADNLLLLFVGWEVMGLCSYLLIGFWFEKHSAYRAAIKAFTTTRVADVIMLLGIVYLYATTGTLNFRDILYNPAPEVEAVTEEGQAFKLDTVFARLPSAQEGESGETAAEGEAHSEGEAASAEEGHTETWAQRLAATPAIAFGGISAAGLIGIFLIIGTIGKSAQFPLHVWLPDAMEGPTPVSAMIHAAAMVSAGVYAIIRMYPLFEAGGHPHDGDFTSPLMLMAIVGSFTALFAATIAIAQNDVKKVLAYSTISQLGFMVAALGIGGFVPAAFHLITHAFFKALLFLASGAVIHGMEHGEHHVHAHGHGHGGGGTDGEFAHDAHAAHGHEHGIVPHAGVPHAGSSIEPHDAAIGDEHDTLHAHAFDPQDMMNMGGLRKTMPITFITFLIGGLSLSGLPLVTAGFWSKDEILAEAWLGLTEGFGPHALVFIALALAAFMTAFYTARQLCLTFLGEPRTEEAKHASLGNGVVSATMTLPLIILSVFAIIAGFVGVHPDFPILGGIFSANGNPFFNLVTLSLVEKPPKIDFNIIPVLFSFGIALGGLWLGYLVYGRKPLTAGQPDPMIDALGSSVHNTLKNKYYFDELYTALLVKPSQWFSRNVSYLFLDKGVIDGFLHLIGRAFTWFGDMLKVVNAWLIDGVGDGVPELFVRFGAWARNIQTGRVQQYMLLIIVVALIIGIVFAVSTGTLQASP